MDMKTFKLYASYRKVHKAVPRHSQIISDRGEKEAKFKN